MELPEKGKQDFLSYSNDKTILAEVILQLEKDITLAGGSLELNDDCRNDAQLLRSSVCDFILKIMTVNPELYFNILYRIDLLPAPMNADEVTDAVLSRELLKVLTRRYYK